MKPPMREPVSTPTNNGIGKRSRPAGRPRSEAAHCAVLDCAYAILAETGLSGFSIEAVAARSGVARTTIYRWWPRKGLLAMDSFLAAFKPQLAYGESADAVEDFRKLLGSLVQALSGPAGLIAASVVAEAQTDAETRAAFVERFSTPLRDASSKLLHRGIREGRLRVDLDVAVALDIAVGAVYLRLMLGQRLDAAWSHELFQTVLWGCHTI